MEFLPDYLTSGASAARERLAQLSVRTAQANVREHSSALGAMMSAAAREAIFADALLGAVRARLEELKNVTK